MLYPNGIITKNIRTGGECNAFNKNDNTRPTSIAKESIRSLLILSTMLIFCLIFFFSKDRNAFCSIISNALMKTSKNIAIPRVPCLYSCKISILISSFKIDRKLNEFRVKYSITIEEVVFPTHSGIVEWSISKSTRSTIFAIESNIG
eukprot:NODE_932_length_2992_cov_0.336675.p3 type:complete len:147 gc:universal NODE_932_length_2992_cov_0.336675:2471-2031(-)